MRADDAAADQTDHPERPGFLRGNGPQPLRGGNSGSGGKGDHGTRRL